MESDHHTLLLELLTLFPCVAVVGVKSGSYPNPERTKAGPDNRIRPLTFMPRGGDYFPPFSMCMFLVTANHFWALPGSSFLPYG